ncbi:unnamed protein product [Allacma fusca]|uniref:Splicing factor Cactin n=1 Tax=Allacma fusca TaxID=39272 RepID=A0A8J2Q7A5_9HEXA|nr:unnamed protein product [Allacma fusca]
MGSRSEVSRRERYRSRSRSRSRDRNDRRDNASRNDRRDTSSRNRRHSPEDRRSRYIQDRGHERFGDRDRNRDRNRQDDREDRYGDKRESSKRRESPDRPVRVQAVKEPAKETVRKAKSPGSESDSRSRSSSKKKSKKTKVQKSSSESESDSSDSETVLMIKLEKERVKQLDEAKKRKEHMKALETPEEKRLRRLGKKEEKERKRKERMGWDNEYLHYTNTDNPFGDNNLLDTFVWKKKLEKHGLEDISREELERINRFKQEESKRELEKVKKRRIERELERQRREEEEALLQRQKEAAQFKEWGNQEDLFHLEQARLRSKIRIKDGRAKPIDLLAQYISAEEEVNAIEMHEPYTYLNGLTVTDLEDLIEDIKVYKELERGKNLSYWNDITVIVEDELRKLRKLEQDEDYRVAMDRREGINPAVANEVASIFKGKSTEQLQQLKSQIQSKLDGSSSGVDIKQGVAGEENDQPGPSGSNAIELEEPTQDSVHSHSPQETEEEEVEDVVGEAITRYNAGSFTPKLISQDDIEPGIFVIGEEEDDSRLLMARSQVLNIGQRVENVWTAEEKALQLEAKKGMDNDEAVFSVESPLDHVYLWSDKYRPRKPRYFNRVHTGFEWNKYNQTHYDMDNPPPKIVQGYKFNIFYPDLIEKNSTPEYKLSNCADNPDFAILRFKAGPPYEDIAFKIVNREWEYSYKRGFRCQFHNNIFQLWFHFKRYRYRR